MYRGTGQPEEDWGNQIVAIATIVCLTVPAQDQTKNFLHNYAVSAVINTGATYNFSLHQVVKNAGLKF